MKKLLSISFLMLSMIFVSISVEAAPSKKSTDAKAKTTFTNDNNQIVDIYRETETVWLYGKKYLKVYQVKVFEDGSTTSQLVNSVNLSNRFDNKHRRVETFYQTEVIWQNGQKYEVTYKITRFRNGQIIKQLINTVRVR